MNESQIERLILDARAKGEKYVGRYIRHTAARVAELDDCLCSVEIEKTVCRVIGRIDKEKSLLDCIKIREEK